LILQLEHLVHVLRVHHVGSGPNIFGVLSLGDKAKLEFITCRVDAIGVLPVLGINTIDTALLSAGVWVRTKVFVPRVASIAVRISAGVVDPSPVGIQGNGFGGLVAAAGITRRK